MAYGDFTLKEIENKFGIKNRIVSLFEKLPATEPSAWLMESLKRASSIPARSEKAKSETIVFPILLEVRDRNSNYITIYSGDNLNADDEKGLKGECDFIIAKDTESFDISSPILQMVEAKKHDIDVGVPQCAAQMVGAKIFNQKNNTEVPHIYGCVTTGDEWLFLKLGEELHIDKRKYYLNELGELLTVFQHIINSYKNNQ